MQPREPLLSSQTPFNEQLVSLQHVNDDAVFYSGKQHGKHLDLLLHLSRYSNLLLTVTGQQGSGKTHLKNRMLQQLDSGVVVSLLDAEKASSAAQLLPLISQSLNIEIPAKANFDFYLTEIRNFSSQLNDEGGSCLIVIDNAENLEQDAINLILDLATTTSDSHRPHLALFGRQELFNKLHQKENITRFESVGHHLPLEAFSESEARAYLEHRCSSVGIEHLPLDDKQFTNAFKASKGLPGLLNIALVEQLKNTTGTAVMAPSKTVAKKTKAKPVAKPKKAKSTKDRKLPIWPLLAASTVIAIVVAGYIYKDQLVPSSTPDTSLISRSHDLRQGKETPWQPPPAFNKQDPATEPEIKQTATQEPAVVAEIELTPIVTKPEVAVSVPAESLLDLPDDTPATTQPVKVIAEAPKVEETPKRVEAPKKATVAPKIAAKPPAQKTTSWADKGSRREATLMAKPADHFTLQMMGSLDETSVKGFIQAQTNNTKAFSYFEGRYKGQPWYVVVYGDYSDRDKALAAIQNLPEALQKQRPWARNFLSVQNDIRSR